MAALSLKIDIILSSFNELSIKYRGPIPIIFMPMPRFIKSGSIRGPMKKSAAHFRKHPWKKRRI